MPTHGVPEIRIRVANDRALNAHGGFVLYWMIAARRPTFNFALDRAVEWAAELRKPVVILEALRNGYEWASDRIHRFVLQGMAENAAHFESTPALYYPYVEIKKDAGKGLLRALAERACLVVTDEYPCFFLPRMLAAAAKNVSVRVEAVDSNGLLPLRASQEAFPTAYAFRRFLQKQLPAHLFDFPRSNPFAKADLPKIRKLPEEITNKWSPAPAALLRGEAKDLAEIPIDHSVAPVSMHGGSRTAEKRLANFVQEKLQLYGEARNEPERDATSGLSSYLHFGHISAHQIFQAVAAAEKWTPKRVAVRATGSREGWWGLSPNAESFLDQAITWRELGFHFCQHRKDYDSYDSLPEWALKTLKEHTRDERANVYTPRDFESAATHDTLWNAAQIQLLTEGRIHNYMRMLWGKKILEWSKSPQQALQTMVHLNNKYALDGRDPNSYSGIFWCLGRFDRPWGPERPIFGTVRYMSSENTARKFNVKGYVKKYSPPGTQGLTILPFAK